MRPSCAFFTVLVVLVGLERLAELVVSRRNAAWSFARGGVESGQAHYPPMVRAPHRPARRRARRGLARRPAVRAAALGWRRCSALVLLAQALRWWCIATLGRQWNTRVIVVPGLPLVRRGPYRLVPHPNYVAVVVEGVALPLVHPPG